MAMDDTNFSEASSPSNNLYNSTTEVMDDKKPESPVQYAFLALSPEEAEQRLRELAQPYTAEFASIHSVTLQPCSAYRSQDRHVVKQLDVHGQLWTFTGVFDGRFTFVWVLYFSLRAKQ